MEYVITALVSGVVSGLVCLYVGYRWGQSAINKLVAEANAVKKVL